MMRILLVDDEPHLRELLRVTFEDAQVAVDEAGSAAEAEAAIARELPSAIVLDLHMPGMGGAELCRRLRADERTRDVPIVLLTGAEGDELARATECGADAVVRKPFSPLALLAVVERSAEAPGRTPTRPRLLPPLEEGELLVYARDLNHLLGLEREHRRRLKDSYRATVQALANALAAKDTGTGRHSDRVVRYASALIEALDPGALERDEGIEFGFMLHDVGKIGIPDAILRKAGKLTGPEWSLMQRHTVLGEEMLRGIPFLDGEARRIVRSHHERWEGGGYPDGLVGEEIPLGARIIAVCDAFDAMTSERPYRGRMNVGAALEELERHAGTQFDGTVVEAFCRAVSLDSVMPLAH
jgi:response regulator RpfG family c-di-GMP phosphodiesterase